MSVHFRSAPGFIANGIALAIAAVSFTAASFTALFFTTISIALFFATPVAAQDAPPLLVIPAPASAPLVLAAAQHITPLLNNTLQGRNAVLNTALGAAVTGCGDPGCVGALVAAEGGHSALLIRQHEGMLELALVMAGSGDILTQGMRVPVPESESESESESAIAALLGTASINRLARAVPSPPTTTSVLITTNVIGAEIRVDGEPLGHSPLGVIRLTPGPHQIALSAPGYDNWTRSVNVLPEGARANAWLEPSSQTAAEWADEEANGPNLTTAHAGEEWHEKWWVWAVIGGGALLVAGLIAGIAVAASGDDNSGAIPVPPIPGGM